MSGIGAIRKKIEEAFATALQGATTAPRLSPRDLNLDTKQSYYTEIDSHQFHRRADALITAAVHSPHVKLHRNRADSYYVGDIDKQPRAEDLFAEAVKHCLETAQKERK